MPAVCWLALWVAGSLLAYAVIFWDVPELDENMMPVSTRPSQKSRPTTPVRSCQSPETSSTSRPSLQLLEAGDGQTSSRRPSPATRNPFLTLLKDSMTDPSISSPMTRILAEIEREKALTESEDFRQWQEQLTQ